MPIYIGLSRILLINVNHKINCYNQIYSSTFLRKLVNRLLSNFLLYSLRLIQSYLSDIIIYFTSTLN